MENISFSVLPIDIICLGSCLVKNRPFFKLILRFDRLHFFSFLPTYHVFVCSLKLHLVRVDNFRFFLKIKRTFRVYCCCLTVSFRVLNLVGRLEVLRIGVLHESVCLPLRLPSGVRHGKLLICNVNQLKKQLTDSWVNTCDWTLQLLGCRYWLGILARKPR